MIIHLASPTDAKALSLLGSATFLETYADKISGPDIVAHCERRHAAAIYKAWILDPLCKIWIAKTELETPIGYLVLTPATLPEADPHPNDLEIQRIYLLSRFHGSGVGFQLMTHAIVAAEQRGTRQLVLGVLKKNTRAVAFYRRQGFTKIGARCFQVGAATFDDYVLGRMI